MHRLSEQDAQDAKALIEPVLYEVRQIIVGQNHLLNRLMVALIAGGHVLVEGAPGLAKTLVLKCLAQVSGIGFQRIQFTPDLLPSDLIGTRIYNVQNNQFETEKGPVFSNFVLADEINRAPAKVQSALLEVMEEHQVTIGKETFTLPLPLLVMATQNPIESGGTYPLPEAQLDRFMMKLLVDYPSPEEELVILQRDGTQTLDSLNQCLTQAAILTLQEKAKAVYLDPTLMQLIVTLVQKTRQVNHSAGSLKTVTSNSINSIAHGASPRGSLALARAARALALIDGRAYVTPDDIKSLAQDCLRHRIVLGYDAIVENQSVDAILYQLIAGIDFPRLQSL
ncbi:MAG: AAA family ATPase [Cyanobacteria bacterium P01_H01_bin.74]